MDEVQNLIKNELSAINDLSISQLKSDVDLVAEVGHHIAQSSGKRLRPILTLLTAKTLGKCNPVHIKFATVIEFIHTATLLHDDVVDLSQLRRGKPTANAKFGNSPSVLVGDFLYTKAFQLLVDIGNMQLLKAMADSTNIIAEGEVMQLEKSGDPSTNESQYLDIIHRKTATLFSSASFGAAVLSQCDSHKLTAMSNYGRYLGLAFQITDDILDYTGDAKNMGKNLGDDLAEGRMTLPLIRVMQTGSSKDTSLIISAISEKDRTAFGAVLDSIYANKAIEYCKNLAFKYRDLACAEIDFLKASEAKEGLHKLCQISVDRLT